jgi:hypothetical protein
MPKKEKPVKIKRYKNQSSKRAVYVQNIKKVLAAILILLLLVCLGFLLAKAIGHIAGSGKKDKVDSASPVASGENSQTEVIPQSENIENENNEMPPRPKEQCHVYYYAKPDALSTKLAIDETVKRARSQGADSLVFDAKDNDGYVHYNSKNQYAEKLLSEKQVDIDYLVEKCGENSITPVARISAFMDKMISTVERSTAVMYKGTDTRWLDTSAALGGKPWANPASDIMQKYIVDLTDELISKKVTNIIYSNFKTPTGYSLEYRDFGAPMESVQANMTNLIKILMAKASAAGGAMYLQVEYSAVEQGDYARYIVHPYQLGCTNYIITAPVDIDIESAVSKLKTSKDKNEDIDSVILWLGGPNNSSDSIKKLGGWFVN